MDAITWQRWVDYSQAWQNSFCRNTVYVILALLIGVPVLLQGLYLAGRLPLVQRNDILKRYSAWIGLVPVILLPILAGALWTMLAVCLLCLFCFREFAQVTPLRHDRALLVVGYLGILLLSFANLDHYYRLFMALIPLTAGMMAIVALRRDEPSGYIQRVALAVWAFILFGSGLSHLGFMANDGQYRSYLILIILCVELNDIFAFTCGKLFGKRKLIPQTSPNKTVAGALGAILLTTSLFYLLGQFVFADTKLDHWVHLLVMGLSVSILGQCGDLVLSSIKRDLGIKDMANWIPGHGGLLDRFDSLVLVAPALLHYINYHLNLGHNQPTHVWSRHWL